LGNSHHQTLRQLPGGGRKKKESRGGRGPKYKVSRLGNKKPCPAGERKGFRKKTEKNR